MARGRKKGGIRINDIDDREELTNMIINQINSLNKKTKAFKNKGITEQEEYIRQIITEDMGKFNDNGSLSKSKKFYSDKNTVWLKKSLSALIKANNHAFYGTPHKYEKEVTSQIKAVKKYAENYLRKKGYSESFIREVTNDKEFYVQLFDAFANNTSGYGSNQMTEKVALSYKDTDSGLTEEEKNKILSNIEYSQNVKMRIQEEQSAFEEFNRLRNMKKR